MARYGGRAPLRSAPAVAQLYLQRDQPPGVPPLQLTGERTLPDVPEENYWYRRHLVVYEWIASRVGGRRVVDLACGEGYGSAVLARTAASVVGVDANPEAFEHAGLKYSGPKLRFERNMLELWEGDVDCVVFLQTIEHVQDPDAVLARLRALVGPDGVAYVSTPNVLTLAPEGRGALGQSLARPRVPRRGVPGAVRAPLRLGRAARPVPRAQAARPPGGDRAARVGPHPPGAAAHEAVLRPLHAGDLRPRLRPALGRPRPRAGLPRRAATVSGRSPGRFCLVLHTHMPYVEGYGTWPFGEEWLWEAMATSYLPLLDVLDAAPGRATLSLTPVLCDQLEAPGVGRALPRVPARRAGRDPPARRRGGGGSGARARARALRRPLRRGRRALRGARRRPRGAPSRRTRRGRRRRPTRCCRCWPRPRACACSSRRGSRRTAGASATGTAGCWLPECGYAPWLDEELEEAGVHAACVDLTDVLGYGAPAQLRPLRTGAGPLLVPIDRAIMDLVWHTSRLSLARRLPQHAPLHRAPPHAVGGRRRAL